MRIKSLTKAEKRKAYLTVYEQIFNGQTRFICIRLKYYLQEKLGFDYITTDELFELFPEFVLMCPDNYIIGESFAADKYFIRFLPNEDNIYFRLTILGFLIAMEK